jgi:uncharacterized damage-inducible protein DinB
MEPTNVTHAVTVLLAELIDGPAPKAAWMMNPGDLGLLRSLDKLSAEQASAVPQGGGASIAAHVDHLCYGLHLLNRWSNGEQNPFADADYKASWSRIEVSPDEWTARREELRRQAYAWRDAIQRPRSLSDFELMGVVASVAHLAYHVGAVRQIDRSTRGPSAND